MSDTNPGPNEGQDRATHDAGQGDEAGEYRY